MKRLSVLMLAAACLIAQPEKARAQERYAAFVADMQTGDVLHARRADAARYPASLTKMMTLYMLFEALEAGELSLTETMTASAEAASRPASHLGLSEGDEISVEDAIRALIIQSANDVAVVVAEHLEGSEIRFANAMTRRAHRLGMSQTLFRNASGLPDPRQQTTARDMARLAYALHRDFPQYYAYFNETRFRWNGTTHHTHNSLVGQFEGVDGLKTGYIRASGYNIAVTVEREDQRLVAIVMGGASASVRDAHARELIDAAYTALEARTEGLMLAALDMPRLNPVREQEQLTAELTTLPAQTAMGSAPGSQPAQVVLTEPQALRAPARVSFATADAELTELPEGWAVQVGAYASQAAASARLESVAMMGLQQHLRDARAQTEAVSRNNRHLWRARYVGLTGSAAQAVCAQVQAAGDPCFTVPPAG